MDLNIVDLLSEIERLVGSKRRLADRLHVSSRILSDWQHGKIHMRPENRERIITVARELDIDPSAFDAGSLKLWDPHVSHERNSRRDQRYQRTSMASVSAAIPTNSWGS